MTSYTLGAIDVFTAYTYAFVRSAGWKFAYVDRHTPSVWLPITHPQQPV